MEVGQFLLLRATITADSYLTCSANYTSTVWVLLNPSERDGMVFIVICFQKPLYEELKTDCGNPLILWLKKRCIALYEITGFVGVGGNLTCNSFTSAVHIVREVRVKDCSTQIRHMMHGWEYKPQGGTVFSEFTLAICILNKTYKSISATTRHWQDESFVHLPMPNYCVQLLCIVVVGATEYIF